MADQKNEVQVTFSDVLNDKLINVETALAKDFNRVRSVQNFIAYLNDPNNASLQKCNKASIVTGFMKSCYLGLSFVDKECYLIVYGNNAVFQTDYKGEVKFTKRYSIRPIQDIYAKVIREGDKFEEVITDGHPSINFKPLPLNSGKIMGVFAVCLFKDGGLQYEVMTTDDVNNVRNNYSKAAQSKAWKNSFDEMAKKTVLRRLCKHIECDFESVEARQAWDEASDSNVVQQRKTDEVVDVFANTKNFTDDVGKKLNNAEESEENENIIEDDGKYTEISDDDLPDFLKPTKGGK